MTLEERLKNILAGIQNGADANFEELEGIERVFIEQEANEIMLLLRSEIQRALDEAEKQIISILDGNKEVYSKDVDEDRKKGQEKEEMDSCCNETLNENIKEIKSRFNKLRV